MSPDTVDALLAPLAEDAALLLAVSGGPDSTALLLMVADWSRRRGGPPVSAATFDHGFRIEGAREAADVAALCARLGVPHAILRWNGEAPATRLQERARDARYAALAARAREIGANVIVTAHHRDDQAETVLFRLARGSGVAGLAGMAARTTRDGVALARPLLGVAKAELVAYCEAEGVPFASDPSNADRRFARVRMRELMRALAAEGLDADRFARLSRRAHVVEEALGAQTAAVEARLRFAKTGACEACGWLAEPIEIGQRLLAQAVANVGRRDPRRIGLEKIEAVAAALRAAITAGERFSANLAGALVVCEGGRISVAPEPPRAISAREGK